MKDRVIAPTRLAVGKASLDPLRSVQFRSWLSDTKKLSCMWPLGAGSRMRCGANAITAVHGFYVQLVDFAARLEERGAMLATSDNAPETNFTFMRQTSNH